MRGKEVLAEKQEQKPQFVEKLQECLQDDIKKVFEEIADIKTEILKDWLISEQSNTAEVKETLYNLMDRLTICQSDSQLYRKYQKEFKV